MGTAAVQASVFVSYAHESEEHRRAVLAFAQQLRRAGVDCWLDQFDEIPPPASWPVWMYQQMSRAEVVLVVCSESYRRRVEGREAAGVGLGARWEGAIITQELYEQPPGGRVKYVPVLFSSDDLRHIPYFLRSTTHHVVSPTEPRTYGGLLRQLYGRPTAVPEPLGAAAVDRVPVPVASRDRETEDLPAQVSLLGLLGPGSTDPDRLRDRWANPDPSGAVLGMADDGVVAFDPAGEGPHYLVAGAIGSGKSTVLRTMLASLALRHPPDAWRFVLVDFKGGGALEPLTALPHVLGVVNDLDAWTYPRLLRMLRVEAGRRRLALAAAGASNVGWLDARSGAAAGPAIPRLLIVIDEYASLVVELPDLVADLVALARMGRSLGIHLVLCTQRAGRAVPAELQSHISGRICLRVADVSDSQEVLGSPAAADLPPQVKGRALRSVHGRSPRPFQVAELTEEDAGAVVAAAAAAAGPDAGRRWPRWPPPLPPRLDLDRGHLAPAGTGFTAVVGLADLPDELAQVPWAIELDRSGAALAVGTRGSGRTTWLTTVGRSLAARYGDAWDLFAASLDGELADLAQLPQCRAATASEATLARDVVLLADAELATRRIGARLLAGGGRRGDRRLVVAVDRLDLLLQGPEADALLAAVQRLAAEGPAAGVHLIATTDAAGAGRRNLAKLFSHHLLLYLGDRREYLAFGLTAADVPPWQLPGRGLWLPDRVEVQVARIG